MIFQHTITAFCGASMLNLLADNAVEKIYMSGIKFLPVLLLVILIQPASVAVAAPVNQVLLYEAHWSGAHVGRMAVAVKLDDSAYDMKVEMRSLGIAKAAGKFVSTANGKGVIQKSGSPGLGEYASHTQLRKQIKDVTIAYDAKGKLVSDTVIPPDKREKRPAVDVALKTDTLNPLTAIIAARVKIAAGAKEFELPLYDGRRRSKLEFKVLGMRDMKNVNGSSGQLMLVTMRRLAVAGYTGNELKRIKNEEPLIKGYLDPTTLIPHYVEGIAILGSATATLKTTCSSFTECQQKLGD